eukprot:scaffold133183_cov30-Tisochrysis_lutea.AAC.4
MRMNACGWSTPPRGEEFGGARSEGVARHELSDSPAMHTARWMHWGCGWPLACITWSPSNQRVEVGSTLPHAWKHVGEGDDEVGIERYVEPS